MALDATELKQLVSALGEILAPRIREAVAENITVRMEALAVTLRDEQKGVLDGIEAAISEKIEKASEALRKDVSEIALASEKLSVDTNNSLRSFVGDEIAGFGVRLEEKWNNHLGFFKGEFDKKLEQVHAAIPEIPEVVFPEIPAPTKLLENGELSEPMVEAMGVVVRQILNPMFASVLSPVHDSINEAIRSTESVRVATAKCEEQIAAVQIEAHAKIDKNVELIELLAIQTTKNIDQATAELSKGFDSRIETAEKHFVSNLDAVTSLIADEGKATEGLAARVETLGFSIGEASKSISAAEEQLKKQLAEQATQIETKLYETAAGISETIDALDKKGDATAQAIGEQAALVSEVRKVFEDSAITVEERLATQGEMLRHVDAHLKETVTHTQLGKVETSVIEQAVKAANEVRSDFNTGIAAANEKFAEHDTRLDEIKKRVKNALTPDALKEVEARVTEHVAFATEAVRKYAATADAAMDSVIADHSDKLSKLYERVESSVTHEALKATEDRITEEYVGVIAINSQEVTRLCLHVEAKEVSLREEFTTLDKNLTFENDVIRSDLQKAWEGIQESINARFETSNEAVKSLDSKIAGVASDAALSLDDRLLRSEAALRAEIAASNSQLAGHVDVLATGYDKALENVGGQIVSLTSADAGTKAQLVALAKVDETTNEKFNKSTEAFHKDYEFLHNMMDAAEKGNDKTWAAIESCVDKNAEHEQRLNSAFSRIDEHVKWAGERLDTADEAGKELHAQLKQHVESLVKDIDTTAGALHERIGTTEVRTQADLQGLLERISTLDTGNSNRYGELLKSITEVSELLASEVERRAAEAVELRGSIEQVTKANDDESTKLLGLSKLVQADINKVEQSVTELAQVGVARDKRVDEIAELAKTRTENFEKAVAALETAVDKALGDASADIASVRVYANGVDEKFATEFETIRDDLAHANVRLETTISNASDIVRDFAAGVDVKLEAGLSAVREEIETRSQADRMRVVKDVTALVESLGTEFEQFKDFAEAGFAAADKDMVATKADLAAVREIADGAHEKACESAFGYTDKRVSDTAETMLAKADGIKVELEERIGKTTVELAANLQGRADAADNGIRTLADIVSGNAKFVDAIEPRLTESTEKLVAQVEQRFEEKVAGVRVAVEAGLQGVVTQTAVELETVRGAIAERANDFELVVGRLTESNKEAVAHFDDRVASVKVALEAGLQGNATDIESVSKRLVQHVDAIDASIGSWVEKMENGDKSLLSLFEQRADAIDLALATKVQSKELKAEVAEQVAAFEVPLRAVAKDEATDVIVKALDAVQPDLESLARTAAVGAVPAAVAAQTEGLPDMVREAVLPLAVAEATRIAREAGEAALGAAKAAGDALRATVKVEAAAIATGAAESVANSLREPLLRDLDPTARIAKAIADSLPNEVRAVVKDNLEVSEDRLFLKLAAKVQSEIDRIPRPRDGVGKDGTDGKDARVVPPVAYEVGKRYEHGAWVNHDNGVWVAARSTDGVPSPDSPDWDCVAPGVKSVESVLLEDGRTLEMHFALSNGAFQKATSKLPIPVNRGVYKATQVYEANDQVTWDGSTWIATKSGKLSTPSTTEAWKLVTKRGSNGKDMRDGPVPLLRRRGVAIAGEKYEANDIVEFAGVHWLATRSTHETPPITLVSNETWIKLGS